MHMFDFDIDNPNMFEEWGYVPTWGSSQDPSNISEKPVVYQFGDLQAYHDDQDNQA